jgi:hypothetical protein
MEGFSIGPGNKGFHITFENGWVVSVQFGAGNYCDHHNSDDYDRNLGHSKTAEIAAWDKDGNWHHFEHDTVDGYKTPAEVLEFINMIASK